VKHLNTLVKPEEGSALTRSLDDYYLPKDERLQPEFLARGYNPIGIPNRGPAGTHDTARLWVDIQAMDLGRTDHLLPSFDKQADDRSPEPFRVKGPVGVFILEGWMVGAGTEVDPLKARSSLKRSVAQALKNYGPIFNRLDALWVFEPPKTIDHIIRQRLEQEESLEGQSGKRGMSAEQIRHFIHYFYEDSWEAGLTTPTPPRHRATFWAVSNDNHEIQSITPKLDL
jgi:pantothenate kinase-related protein Tda10